MRIGLTYIVGGSLLTAEKSKKEKNVYVKNLTYEQNIQQIVQTHRESLQYSTEVQMGREPNDIFLSDELMGPLFNSVRERVLNHQEGPVRVYGLILPIAHAISDFGDHRITISVREIPFNTIEGIRDYLVEQLINNNEVYIYTINVVSGIYDPTSFLPTKKYYIKAAIIDRSQWVLMTEQAETDGRLQHVWDHNINTNMFNDTAEQLNRWLGEQTKNKEPQINPKQNIKKHNFNGDSSDN